MELTYPVLSGLALADYDPATGIGYVLEAFEGWEGSPASSVDVKQKPRGAGAWTGKGYANARHIAAGGKVFMPSFASLVSYENALNKACSYDNVPLVVDEAGIVRSCLVKRTDVVLFKRIGPTVAEWSLQVVAEDPRKLYALVSGSTYLPSTSGGLALPYTIPYSINALQVTGQLSLVNTGNVAGPVFARIEGPCAGPVITHGTQVLSLPSLVLGAGEWLDIDFEKREVLANGQASRNTFIGSRGWSTFEPGPNTWSFTATSYTAGAQLTITATSADK
ncbi:MULTISPECIES: hypothetical protein [unclassified Cryobacterium]|uniref:hypothetical protein n=1 Tax=unclassified Cryobacterium TaxID=2649013 RepID=UPI002AB5DC24|nr:MULTISPECIES: hypothetical protein [unclassified Cryobacterium]MDY7542597.1 hypothetical protein [Cryobacterium sp. 5B3]MEB0264717.1 hypothetical protein [Cryobacterium sp. 10I5]MEB0273689.1 hypothetical protein [Cryobacterium sp. 5B3]